MPDQTKFLETIRCLDGSTLNLEYHQKRVDTSRSHLGFSDRLELTVLPPEPGLYRCRIIYAQTIEKIEYLPYEPKKIRRFKLLDADISYALKYSDRSDIDALFAQRGDADEIIIVKNGLITDTSIANICFYDGNQWLTPRAPLLKGTTRQRYLDSGKIIEADIEAKEIKSYSKIALLNAMIDFMIIEDAIIL